MRKLAQEARTWVERAGNAANAAIRDFEQFAQRVGLASSVDVPVADGARLVFVNGRVKILASDDLKLWSEAPLELRSRCFPAFEALVEKACRAYADRCRTMAERLTPTPSLAELLRIIKT